MTNDNLNPSKGELEIMDIFGSVIIILKHKWLLIIILVISIALGGIYTYFSLKSDEKEFSTLTTANLLIEENSVWTQNEIVKEINRVLSSAYNYEKWSNNNKTLSENLSHKNVSDLIISEKTHTLEFELSSKNSQDAIISYLSNTAKYISSKIVNIISSEIEMKKQGIVDQISDIQRMIRTKEQAYKSELDALENDIININMEINAAEEGLEFILKDLKKEVQDTPIITLQVIELRQKIKINKSKIVNLVKRRDAYSLILLNNRSEGDHPISIDEISKSLNELKSTQLNQKLSNLNNELLAYIETQLSREQLGTSDSTLRIFDLKNTITSNQLITELNPFELDEELNSLNLQLTQLEKDQETLKNKVIIKMGRISQDTIEIEESNTNIALILIIFTIAGLVLGIFCAFVKEELMRSKKLLKH